MDPVVSVAGLRKAYGSVTAAADVAFDVARGEVFGMVGPNGAGKTTILECVSGLRRPDAGRMRVLGLDLQRDRYAVRERIGVQLQAAALPDALKVGEAVALFASFYPRVGDPAAALRRVGLDDRRGARVSDLSGGQRQRLFIALALVHEPEVVLLDELTTGLDPQARRDAWALAREIRERGATVILTTHFMEEAERLCDRVAIVDRGRIVALDTAGRVTTALEEAGVAFDDLRVERPTLEDVFLARTGGAYAGAHARDGGAVRGGGEPRDASAGASAARRP